MTKHTCVAAMANPRNVNAKKINTQGRCTICGKFMTLSSVGIGGGSKATAAVALSTVSGVAQTPPKSKEELLDLFRNKTCMVEYEHHGNVQHRVLSLMPCYLGNYIGNGTSKKANPDTLFLYDVDDEQFRKVSVSRIKTITTL